MEVVILGVLWLLVGNAAVIAGASVLLAKVRTGRGPIDAVIFLLLRLALISATVLVAGLTGTLSGPLLGAMGMAALAGFWVTEQREAIPRFKLPWFGWLAAGATAIVLLKLLVQVWFLAPYTTDVLSYHLPKLAEWIRNGAFTRQLGVDSHAPFPGGYELLQTWWVVFLHNDVIIEMAGVEMLLLASTSVYALAHWVGLSERWAFLAAFIFAMTPGMQMEATSSLNDDAVTALILATMALVVYRAPIGLLAMIVGIGAGVKGSYLYALPGSIVLWFLDRRDQEQERATSTGGKRSEGNALLDRVPLALGGLGVAIGSYWYVRNLVWFGNPVYPMGSKGLIESTGHRAVSFGADFQGFKENLMELIDSAILDNARAYSGLSTNVSGWGAAAFACGLLAMVPALGAESRLRRLSVGFAVSCFFMLLLIIHAPWYTRFFFFVPALLAIATAWLVRSNRWVFVVLVPALALEAIGTITPEEVPLDQLKMLMRQPWNQRSLAEHYGATWEGDALGYYAEDHGESYFLYRPDFSGRVAYLRAMSPETLAQEMRDKHVTMLYAVPGTPERMKVLNDAARHGVLKHVQGRFYALP